MPFDSLGFLDAVAGLPEQLAAAHEATGQSYVSAPLFGPPEAAAAGYRVCGCLAVRFDAAERLSAAVCAAASQGPAQLTPALAGLIARPARDLPPVLRALGFRQIAPAAEAPGGWLPPNVKPPRRSPPVATGPFSPLSELLPIRPSRRRRRP